MRASILVYTKFLVYRLIPCYSSQSDVDYYYILMLQSYTDNHQELLTLLHAFFRRNHIGPIERHTLQMDIAYLEILQSKVLLV